MARNRLSMPGLRHDRHNIAPQLLLSLLERHNGGRWETITIDFGNKPIKSFASHTIIHTPLDYHPPPCTNMPARFVVVDEGNFPDSLTSSPAVLPDDKLPSLLKPSAHKPDFIRLLEATFVGHSNAKRRYSSTKKI
jgi:hypothetical protein